MNNIVAIGRIADVENRQTTKGKRDITFTLYIPVKTGLDGYDFMLSQ